MNFCRMYVVMARIPWNFRTFCMPRSPFLELTIGEVHDSLVRRSRAYFSPSYFNAFMPSYMVRGDCCCNVSVYSLRTKYTDNPPTIPVEGKAGPNQE